MASFQVTSQTRNSFALIVCLAVELRISLPGDFPISFFFLLFFGCDWGCLSRGWILGFCGGKLA